MASSIRPILPRTFALRLYTTASLGFKVRAAKEKIHDILKHTLKNSFIFKKKYLKEL
jgi:hypothetical protein